MTYNAVIRHNSRKRTGALLRRVIWYTVGMGALAFACAANWA